MSCSKLNKSIIVSFVANIQRGECPAQGVFSFLGMVSTHSGWPPEASRGTSMLAIAGRFRARYLVQVGPVLSHLRDF